MKRSRSTQEWPSSPSSSSSSPLPSSTPSPSSSSSSPLPSSTPSSSLWSSSPLPSSSPSPSSTPSSSLWSSSPFPSSSPGSSPSRTELPDYQKEAYLPSWELKKKPKLIFDDVDERNVFTTKFQCGFRHFSYAQRDESCAPIVDEDEESFLCRLNLYKDYFNREQLERIEEISENEEDDPLGIVSDNITVRESTTDEELNTGQVAGTALMTTSNNNESSQNVHIIESKQVIDEETRDELFAQHVPENPNRDYQPICKSQRYKFRIE